MIIVQLLLYPRPRRFIVADGQAGLEPERQKRKRLGRTRRPVHCERLVKELAQILRDAVLGGAWTKRIVNLFPIKNSARTLPNPLEPDPK